jgi:hypothetical protein
LAAEAVIGIRGGGESKSSRHCELRNPTSFPRHHVLYCAASRALRLSETEEKRAHEAEAAVEVNNSGVLNV